MQSGCDGLRLREKKRANWVENKGQKSSVKQEENTREREIQRAEEGMLLGLRVSVDGNGGSLSVR
jgi:hypothetical protein